MGRYAGEAHAVIDAFVYREHQDFYPAWSGVVPGDQVNGWGASVLLWLQESLEIVGAFEDAIGFPIDDTQAELRKLRTLPLAKLQEYLDKKASLANAGASFASFWSAL